MRGGLFIVLVVLLGTVVSATSPIAGNVPADILASSVDPAPACRIAAPSVHLFIVVQDPKDQVPIGQALWQAGVPAGSAARFYWDHDPARALARASSDALAAGVVPIVAPVNPSAAWAAGLLPSSC